MRPFLSRDEIKMSAFLLVPRAKKIGMGVLGVKREGGRETTVEGGPTLSSKHLLMAPYGIKKPHFPWGHFHTGTLCLGLCFLQCGSHSPCMIPLTT